jgi:hypothetical protein
VSAVESALAEAKASNDTFTYCQALVQAGCPVSILVLRASDPSSRCCSTIPRAIRSAFGERGVAASGRAPDQKR